MGLTTPRGSNDSVVTRGSVETSRISRSFSDDAVLATTQRRSAEATIPVIQQPIVEHGNENSNTDTLRSRVSKKDLSNLFEKIDQEELARMIVSCFIYSLSLHNEWIFIKARYNWSSQAMAKALFFFKVGKERVITNA